MTVPAVAGGHRMKFLLKYPTRSREHLFVESVNLWRATASGLHELHWLVSCDTDDVTMNNQEIWEWCRERGVPIYYSENKTKVQAINANMDQAPADWDVLVLVSDDMIPSECWDQIVGDHMPEDLRCGLWFPDGRRRDLCTLSIFGRPILEEVLGGYIYHPEFRSVYCDDYYHVLMQQAGLLKFVDLPVFRHAWGEQNKDALMRRNENPTWYRQDKNTYQRLLQERRYADRKR